MSARGFGERTYLADGKSIRAEPIERKAYGVTRISVGFPFAELSEYVDDDIGPALAEYLSSPMCAAAPDLYRALAECRNLMWADNPADGWKDAIDAADAALAKAGSGA